MHENIEDISVEDDLKDRTIQGYPNSCAVFDGMLDRYQKLVEPFSNRRRHNDLKIQKLTYLKEQLETIRI